MAFLPTLAMILSTRLGMPCYSCTKHVLGVLCAVLIAIAVRRMRLSPSECRKDPLPGLEGLIGRDWIAWGLFFFWA